MSCTLYAIMKNERPYVLEWVAYHRLIGFDRICIYDNESTDGTSELLLALAKCKIIDLHIPWPSTGPSPQAEAYKDAAHHCATDWLMYLDTDEFLNFRSRRNVGAFLGDFDSQTSCIAVNWRIFGSGGHTTYQNAFVIERFTKASSVTRAVNGHVKCFARPKDIEHVHIHAPMMKGGKVLHASGEPLDMTFRGISNRIDFYFGQINHYFCKSREEYGAKASRGDASREDSDPLRFTSYTEEMFNHHDLNDEDDRSILWSVPLIRQILSDWRKLLQG